MINASSLSILDKAQFSHRFRRPVYDSYSYSLIPNTINKLLTGKNLTTLPVEAVGGTWKKHDVVIAFLFDAFGWKFLEENTSTFSFLNRFEKEGVISKISSQFPSTTSAHITTLCTGLEVGQTGIYEWFQYEPLVDRMIAPLLFSFAGDHQVNTLGKTNISPEKIFPFATFYESLKKDQVDSYIIQQENIVHSPYSQAMFKGAQLIGYRNFHEALEQAIDLCRKTHKQPAYIFVYFGDIDAQGHRHGIHSSEMQEAITLCFKGLEDHFWHEITSLKKKTALIITADHGMTSINPRTTYYLNKQCPNLCESLKLNQQGLPLVPAGSCRDFFLHVQENKLAETHQFLSQQLKDIAEVMLVSDLIQEGFFGSLSPTPRFLERVGNLVILPYANESVWWYEKHRFEQNFYAAHGGLTAAEMESIFLYAEWE